jgi:hypothetical protein
MKIKYDFRIAGVHSLQFKYDYAVSHWLDKYGFNTKVNYISHSTREDANLHGCGHYVIDIPEEYQTLLLISFPVMRICECQDENN